MDWSLSEDEEISVTNHWLAAWLFLVWGGDTQFLINMKVNMNQKKLNAQNKKAAKMNDWINEFWIDGRIELSNMHQKV